MASAKDLVLRPIDSRTARDFIRREHYSGKVAQNSQLHIGVFLNGSLEGALQFGPPLDRSKVIGLVEGTRRENFLELNRMAFTEALPRNSESRAIRVAMRIIGRLAPQVKWILSFADATQCGDGTIYRAAGFVLTDVRPSGNLARLPSGAVIHKMTVESAPTAPRDWLGGRSLYDVTDGRLDFRLFCERIGAEILPGFQIRYVGFIDPAWRSRLAVPALPYSAIDEAGARMYRGERR